MKRPDPVFLAASLRVHSAPRGPTRRRLHQRRPRRRECRRVGEHGRTRARAAGRNPHDIEIWQIARLVYSTDGDASRRKIGAILAFVSAYVMGGGDLGPRGKPKLGHGDEMTQLLRFTLPKTCLKLVALVLSLTANSRAAVPCDF